MKQRNHVHVVDWASREKTYQLASCRTRHMDDEEPVSELYPERLVAENITEAVWLRLRRLTSSTLCQRVIEARNPSLPASVLEKKGQEVASSVRSALGYWQSQAESLNAKVLARYYALLQMSIAEQLASPNSTAALKEIQSHTESGHGLWAITAQEKDFPANYMVACRNRGHFYEYCRFRGIDLAPYVSKARPNSWDDLSTVERDRLISLADLLRRIPELQLLIEETLGTEPLSFRAGYATKNRIVQSERMQNHTRKTGQVLFNPPVAEPSTLTYIGIYPDGQNLTAEYLNSFGLPIKNIRPETVTESSYFIGDFTHPSDKHWHQCLQTYKSGYCGTSIIVPFWGKIADPFIIHFMTLYALSIIVRYLPLLWHEIEDGKLDHIRALIEHYVVIVDNVLPLLAVQRLTGRRLIAVQPGSLQGPV
jgi:hypothetical protein